MRTKSVDFHLGWRIGITLLGLLLMSNISDQNQAVIHYVTPADDWSKLSAKLAIIEKAVEAKRRSLNVPGAALAIVKDDRVVLLKGFGLRNVAAKLPVTPETLFAIGSCTKTFTALAAIISADEGKLSLDDSPKKFLPYFKLREPEADSHVTLRDLLSHRTGLKMGEEEETRHFSENSREEVIRSGMRAEPIAKLRERFEYSNVMYLAAGEAIAKAQNTTWEELITSRIFKPLGMTASNFSTTVMQQASDFSCGYSSDQKREKLPMQDLWIGAPAAAINSNAKEMAQWLRLLLGNGSVDGKRLVSEKGFQEMMAKLVRMDEEKSYGLGLIVEELRSYRGRPMYWHGGSVDGFTTLFWFQPDQKLGFAILTNVSSSSLPQETIQIVRRNLVTQP
jgi:CubicO group peptidase (beta-lactamase class C family)